MVLRKYSYLHYYDETQWNLMLFYLMLSFLRPTMSAK